MEERDAAKTLDRLQPHLAEKYAFWRAVVRQSGPGALRGIKSFHHEKLAGKLAHLRSSRLNQQWRMLYRVEADVVAVYANASRHTTTDHRSNPMASKPKKSKPAKYVPSSYARRAHAGRFGARRT